MKYPLSDKHAPSPLNFKALWMYIPTLFERDLSHEKNIPAFTEKKKEQTWFQGKNAYSRWQGHFSQKKSKGTEETICIWREDPKGLIVYDIAI